MSDVAAFIQRLNQTKTLSLKLGNALGEGIRTNRFEAQETFLSPGNYAGSIYFVQSGIVRGAIEGPIDKVSTWFKQEGDLIVPQGLFTQAPSDEYIGAVTGSALQTLSLKHLQKLTPTFPELSELLMLLQVAEVNSSHYREKMLRIPAAKDRYAYVAEKEKFVVKRIPHYMVASYLNVTKETFSRLHKGLAY